MAIFKDTTLGEVLTLQRGFDITKKEQTLGSVPIVSSSGISSFHNESKVKGPGVIIGRKGTLGTSHFIKQDFWPHDTTLWVKDFKGNDPRFISYYLKSLKLENFDTGSSNPTLNRNHLHKIKIVFPELKIQKKIAAIISCYDDAIEANKNKISTLENIVEEIYKEWFVRFRFPDFKNTEFKKTIPKGWDVVKLNSIAIENSKSTKAGDHLKKRKYLPLDVMGAKSFLPIGHYGYDKALSSLVTFEKGEFIFGAMRPYQHKVNLAPFDGITRTTCFVIKPKEEWLYSYLYLTLYKQSTIDFAMLISNGSDRPYTVWKKGFERMGVLKPSKDILILFENRVRPILNNIASYYDFQHNLEEIKRSLLPRLISGKLSVDKLDIQFPPSMLEKNEVN
ncbi:restriction endonuclease subunit S [Pseudoalteromonas sp. 20-92]|uniref:restriction endonuclease subunit S n=1 Tax=Pseudoalteromonas sp. 20-92 TaxID=2969394 RepID=UPI0027AF7F73|nr:restriction endonuclease subunit S [Pseudoalteromonas sp. 20-92]MDQ2043317.1 restriction endonuclease subunit S [Pseudoalteromonas sp. 20-92]